jgi:dipeptidyl aminopeptidase/acylaminoacyl peptidase
MNESTAGIHAFVPQRRLGHYSLALSPDGRRVAYADDSSGQFNIVLQGLDGGQPRPITDFIDHAVTKLAWHPDGRTLYFTADIGGREKMQLFRIGADGAGLEALSGTPEATFQMDTPGRPFSADGRWLAYAADDRDPRAEDVLIRNLDSGEVRRIYAEGGRMLPGHWSPDGQRITAADILVPYGEHAVFVIDTTTAQARRLTTPEVAGTHWLGPWLPDGSGFLVRSNAGREFQGLAVMDADTGRLSWLDTPDWDVEEATLSADGRVLVWTVNVEGATRLRARNMATGEDLDVPPLPLGVGWALNVSADGSRAVLLFTTPSRSVDVLVVELAAGQIRWLTDLGGVPAAVEPTLVRFTAADGTSVPAYVYRPAADGPVPVVMALHGGPAAQARPGYSGGGLFQFLVSQGVAVFAPNVRGSRGYGRAYQTIQDRDWGGIDLRDFADAAAYLAEQDWADRDRIAVFGTSYGGFAVLSCLARLPEVGWAAGVSWCGMSNLVTLAKAAPPTWRAQIAAQIGDYEADADFLTSRSPVTYAEQIRAPLFVLQGANDRRVPRHEADQIVDRLRSRGVEVRYDVYAEEGHGFSKRDNDLKAYADAAEFLLVHLRSAAVEAA